MSKKIMSWIDAMPGVDATDFPAQRDQIAAMIDEAVELASKAEALRAKAYFAGCTLEGNPKVRWSIEAVESAKAGSSNGGWPGFGRALLAAIKAGHVALVIYRRESDA